METLKKANYYTDEVLFEIVKCLGGRETAFFYKPGDLSAEELVDSNRNNPPIRGIKSHNVSYLINNMMRFNFMNKKYNLYHSLSHLQDMPMFSYSPYERKKQYKDFRDNFSRYVVGYDIGMDFDNEIRGAVFPFSLVLKNVAVVKNLFDKYKIRYTIKYSGGYGFHINIPNQFLPNLELRGKMEFCNKFLYGMKTLFNLPVLDYLNTDFNYPVGLRKMWKCPYSLDMKTNMVALPLDDKEFDLFMKGEGDNLVNPVNVLKWGVRNRGLMLRNGDDYGLYSLCSDYFPELARCFGDGIRVEASKG